MFHVICQCCSLPVLALSWLLPLCYSICSAHVHHLHGLASPWSSPSSILQLYSEEGHRTMGWKANASQRETLWTRAGLALQNQILGTSSCFKWNMLIFGTDGHLMKHVLIMECLTTASTPQPHVPLQHGISARHATTYIAYALATSVTIVWSSYCSLWYIMEPHSTTL